MDDYDRDDLLDMEKWSLRRCVTLCHSHPSPMEEDEEDEIEVVYVMDEEDAS